MTINWKIVQARLNSAGFDPAGAVDGIPGPATYQALLSFTAQRRSSATLKSVARECAKHLRAHAISKTPQRLADFLAQTSHETGGFTRFEENMHYSAKRLTAVWPKRFPTTDSALPFAWDPRDPDREDVALANKVYGGRMGNEANGTDDNDGWDHRGSGLLQHTGAAEYAALKQRLGYEPDDVRDPAKSVLAACDYWTRRKVNSFIDALDFGGARRAVNGGLNGYPEITATRSRLLRLFN